MLFLLLFSPARLVWRRALALVHACVACARAIALGPPALALWLLGQATDAWCRLLALLGVLTTSARKVRVAAHRVCATSVWAAKDQQRSKARSVQAWLSIAVTSLASRRSWRSRSA